MKQDSWHPYTHSFRNLPNQLQTPGGGSTNEIFETKYDFYLGDKYLAVHSPLRRVNNLQVKYCSICKSNLM